MVNLQLQPPNSFNLKNLDSWSFWLKQFTIAPGLSKTEEAQQISMILYCIDPETESLTVRFNYVTSQLRSERKICI